MEGDLCTNSSSTGAKFPTTVTLAQFTWKEKFNLLRLLIQVNFPV